MREERPSLELKLGREFVTQNGCCEHGNKNSGFTQGDVFT